MNKERRTQTTHLPSGGWRVSHALILLITLGVIIADHEAKASDQSNLPTPVTATSSSQKLRQLIPESGYLKASPILDTIHNQPIPDATPISKKTTLSSIIIETRPPEQSTDSDLIYRLEQLYNRQEFTVSDGLKAVEQASPQVACTISYEANKTKYFEAYDPYILDGPDLRHAFNIGIGQFAIKDGKLPEFFSLGYDNPFNPYQVVAYMNDALARKQGWAWSPINQGLC